MTDASKLSSVYVIDDGLGHIKVGYATNPEARMRAISAGSMGSLRLAFVREMPGAIARAVERKVHRAMRGSRLGKEWFAATPLEAAAEIDVAVRAICREPEADGVRQSKSAPKYSVQVNLGPELYDRVAALAGRDVRSITNFLYILVKRRVPQIEEKAGPGDSLLGNNVWL